MGITRCYKGLQGVTGGYKESQGSHGVTRGYKVLQGVKGVTRVKLVHKW